jgi:hypothetical protein
MSLLLDLLASDKDKTKALQIVDDITRVVCTRLSIEFSKVHISGTIASVGFDVEIEVKK